MRADTRHLTYATARVGHHPIHAALVPFPFVCFVGCLVTDVSYWATDEVMWQIFSIWLITAGLFTGVLAMLAGLLDLGGNRRIRSQGAAWVHALGNVIALALALVNAFVHSRDGYIAVVPQGLILSALVVLILAGTGMIGRRLSDRLLVQDTVR